MKTWFKHKNTFVEAEDAFWELLFENGRTSVNAELSSEKPLEILETFWKEQICGTENILVGFIAYDFAGELEPKVLDNKPKLLAFPTLCFRAYRKISNLQTDTSFIKPKPHFQSLISDEAYKTMIQSALRHIEIGNLYEINLSRPFVLDFEYNCDSYSLSKALFQANAAPYSGYFQIDQQRGLCSSSPECFLQKYGLQVSTFPIKGTRKRLPDINLDQKLVEELLNNTKEKAEHLMVVDIERNDLGRIAKPGSVKVLNYSKPVQFSHVHHLISEVSCEIQDGLNVFDVLRATFPSGSITGAPKVKTMQTIRELEPYNRSAYTGCFGYIDGNGDAEFSILIRSLLINGQKAVLNTGGGIVYDSEPDFEIAETYLKAQSFFQFFEIST